MNAPTIALLTRTLRVEARSFMPYAGRLALVGIVFFILLFIGLEMSMSRSGAPGLGFFKSLSYLNFWAITIAALSYFSSAITEEKEEMTLGLLKMTGLNPIAILLGKSTCRLISTVLLLVVQLPFTMLAITFGGISMEQIGATYVALLAYLIFASNLALFFSVVTPRTGYASALTALTLASFFIVPPIAKGILVIAPMGGPVPMPEGAWGTVARAAMTLTDASVFERTGFILSSAYMGGTVSFQVVTNVVAGIVFFLLAWAVFNFFTRSQKEVSPSRFGAFRRARALPIFAVGRVWRQPLVWKDYFFLTGGKVMAVARVASVAMVVGGIVGVSWYFFDEPIGREMIGGCLIGFALTFMALDLAVCASRLFHEEIRWKTLPALALLPKSLGGIAWGKTKACLLAQLPYIGCLFAGMFIVPEFLAEFLDDVVFTLTGLPSLLAATSYIAFFYYLTVYLSLVLKRGALAVAFLICTFGVFFVSMFLGLFLGFIFALASAVSSMDFVLAVAMLAVSSVFILLCVLIHFRIGPRLERTASQL